MGGGLRLEGMGGKTNDETGGDTGGLCYAG